MGKRLASLTQLHKFNYPTKAKLREYLSCSTHMKVIAWLWLKKWSRSPVAKTGITAGKVPERNWCEYQYLNNYQIKWWYYFRSLNTFHVFFYYRGDWQILLLLSNKKEKVELAAVKLFLSNEFWEQTVSKPPTTVTEIHWQTRSQTLLSCSPWVTEGTGSWWTVRSPWLPACNLCRGSGCYLCTVIEMCSHSCTF